MQGRTDRQRPPGLLGAQQALPSPPPAGPPVLSTAGVVPTQTVCNLPTVINSPAENIPAARSLYTLMIT